MNNWLKACRRVALPIIAGFALASLPAAAQQQRFYGATGYGTSMVGAYNPYTQAGPGQTAGRPYGAPPVAPYPPAYGAYRPQAPAYPIPAPVASPTAYPQPPAGQVAAYNPWRMQQGGGYAPAIGGPAPAPAAYAPPGRHVGPADPGATLPNPPPGPIRSRLVSVPEVGNPRGAASPLQTVPYMPRRTAAARVNPKPRTTVADVNPPLAAGGTGGPAFPPPRTPTPRIANPPSRTVAKPPDPAKPAAARPAPARPAQARPAQARPVTAVAAAGPMPAAPPTAPTIATRPPAPPKPPAAAAAAPPPKPAEPPRAPVPIAKPPETPKPAPSVATAPAEPPKPAPPPMAAKPPEPPKAAPPAAAKPVEPPKPTAVVAAAPPQPTAPPPPPAPVRPAVIAPARVTFETNSPALSTDARTSLDRLAAELLAHPERRATLKSYSSGATGSETRRLALARGLAVRAYLIDKGVARERLDVLALGASADGGPADRVDAVPGTGT